MDDSKLPRAAPSSSGTSDPPSDNLPSELRRNSRSRVPSETPAERRTSRQNGWIDHSVLRRWDTVTFRSFWRAARTRTAGMMSVTSDPAGHEFEELLGASTHAVQGRPPTRAQRAGGRPGWWWPGDARRHDAR